VLARGLEPVQAAEVTNRPVEERKSGTTQSGSQYGSGQTRGDEP